MPRPVPRLPADGRTTTPTISPSARVGRSACPTRRGRGSVRTATVARCPRRSSCLPGRASRADPPERSSSPRSTASRVARAACGATMNPDRKYSTAATRSTSARAAPRNSSQDCSYNSLRAITMAMQMSPTSPACPDSCCSTCANVRALRSCLDRRCWRTAEVAARARSPSLSITAKKVSPVAPAAERARGDRLPGRSPAEGSAGVVRADFGVAAACLRTPRRRSSRPATRRTFARGLRALLRTGTVRTSRPSRRTPAARD